MRGTKKILEEGQAAQRERSLVPFNRLIAVGLCHWMVSHSHDWVDNNGVAFSIKVKRIGSHIFCNFWGKKSVASGVLKLGGFTVNN